MSQHDPTDLLCSSRREQLKPDEQRRLRESLQYSLEVRLMSGILPELERESRVRPGDDVLLARINARAFAAIRSRAAPIKAPAKRRVVMLLVAAAVLLVAGLAGAWLGGARPQRAPAPASPSATVPSTVSPRPKARPLAPVRPVAPTESVEVVEPLAATPSAPTPRAREPKETPPSSPSELFARANSLRRQGRAAEAAAVYELLLALHPESREVGPTRLALAKYLQTAHPERALAQFVALASAGGALRAEALWGTSEVATALERRSVSEQALAELVREFPDSPYAEVARRRVAP